MQRNTELARVCVETELLGHGGILHTKCHRERPGLLRFAESCGRDLDVAPASVEREAELKHRRGLTVDDAFDGLARVFVGDQSAGLEVKGQRQWPLSVDRDSQVCGRFLGPYSPSLRIRPALAEETNAVAADAEERRMLELGAVIKVARA